MVEPKQVGRRGGGREFLVGFLAGLAIIGGAALVLLAIFFL